MSFLQVVSTIASIISIPLAIHYANKTADATNDKARLEIIKTLSYKLSIDYTLCYDDVESVYRSKLREHKIKKASFSITDVVHGLKSDVMANAFIANEIRSKMLLNLSEIHEPSKQSEISRGGLNHFVYRFCISPIPNIMFVLSIIFNVFILSFYGVVFMRLLYDTYCYFFAEWGMHGDTSLYDAWCEFYNFTKLDISIPILITLGLVVIIKNLVKRHKDW